MAGVQGYHGDGEPAGGRDAVAAEQLVLADPDDERLPWLEASDFDEPDHSLDAGRLAGFALLFLLVLAAGGAAYWYLSRPGSSGDLQPEGTLIAAPDGPYKVRPVDEGGKTFEGTGDTSFAVGEGQRTEGRLAVRPVATPEPTVGGTPTPEPSPSQGAQSPAPSGPVVQVGAYANRADAERGWQTLMRQTERLNGVSHRIVEGRADIGTVFRLQAVAGNLESARQLCAALKQDGVACQVKR